MDYVNLEKLSEEPFKFVEDCSYKDYVPQCESTYKTLHPTTTIETEILASVKPPEITIIPHTMDIITKKLVSSVQAEAMLLAIQAFEEVVDGTRSGFLIQDSTGLGKGRTIALTIFENMFRASSAKAIWISKSQDLFNDARRDLDAIEGETIPMVNLNEISRSDPIEMERGVLFATYHNLVYSSPNAPGDRRQQIIDWVTPQFDGVICLDECHAARGVSLPHEKKGRPKQASKIGSFFQQLHQDLKLARFLYSSATGACEPEHLLYMERLHLWGPNSPFTTSAEFLKDLKTRGNNGLEMTIRDLKARGMCLARQLSFEDATCELIDVDIGEEGESIYNQATELWNEILSKFCGADWRFATNIWASHLRFFKTLLIAFKMPKIVNLTRLAVDKGMAVVIGIQSTGYAAQQRLSERGNLDQTNVVREIIERLIRSHPEGDKDVDVDSDEILSGIPLIQRDLIRKLYQIPIPSRNLDSFIEELGGPDAVAEMTSRKSRLVKNKGSWVMQSRKPSATNKELESFNNGSKFIAIISDAASTGVSLHAKNQGDRQRVHITLELPWSAEKLIQQMGRTFRCGQISKPMFAMCITTVPGEFRFATIMAKRLRQLGAFTMGDHKAIDARIPLEVWDLDNEIGKKALQIIVKRLASSASTKHMDPKVVSTNVEIRQRFNNVIRDVSRISSFPILFNKILGLPCHLQNSIFEQLWEAFEKETSKQKREGTYKLRPINVLKMKVAERRQSLQFEIQILHDSKKTKAILHTIKFDRGSSWDLAEKTANANLILGTGHHGGSGFYLRKFVGADDSSMIMICLLIRKDKQGSSKSNTQEAEYFILRPHQQLTPLNEPPNEFFEENELCPSLEKAQDIWNLRYIKAEAVCIHQALLIACSQAYCIAGLRIIQLSILQCIDWRLIKALERSCGVVGFQQVQFLDDFGKSRYGYRIPEELLDSITRYLENYSRNSLKLEDLKRISIFGKQKGALVDLVDEGSSESSENEPEELEDSDDSWREYEETVTDPDLENDAKRSLKRSMLANTEEQEEFESKRPRIHDTDETHAPDSVTVESTNSPEANLDDDEEESEEEDEMDLSKYLPHDWLDQI